MSLEARCPQCVFLSRQVGQPTACLLHVQVAASEQESVEHEYDEPYTFGQVHPTVDRPGPFSLREYVRLMLLRSRIHDQRPFQRQLQLQPDEPHEPAQVGGFSRR